MAHGITEAQVHAAADALVEAGDRPTVERIRAHLGAGSPNTVTRYLDSWWGELGGRLAAKRVSAALPTAPAEVVDLASRWWEVALSASRSHIESEMASERAAIAAAQAALATMPRRSSHAWKMGSPLLPGGSSASSRRAASGGSDGYRR